MIISSNQIIPSARGFDHKHHLKFEKASKITKKYLWWRCTICGHQVIFDRKLFYKKFLSGERLW